MVTVGRRVRDAQWAINTVAIFDFLVDVIAIVGAMTRLTEVSRAEAAKESYTTAILALPVDLIGTVLLTNSGPCTDLTQKTALAHKLLFLRALLPLCISHFLLTVDQATKVGLLALEALVEGASVVRILLWPTIVSI